MSSEYQSGDGNKCHKNYLTPLSPQPYETIKNIYNPDNSFFRLTPYLVPVKTVVKSQSGGKNKQITTTTERGT